MRIDKNLAIRGTLTDLDVQDNVNTLHQNNRMYVRGYWNKMIPYLDFSNLNVKIVIYFDCSTGFPNIHFPTSPFVQTNLGCQPAPKSFSKRLLYSLRHLVNQTKSQMIHNFTGVPLLLYRFGVPCYKPPCQSTRPRAKISWGPASDGDTDGPESWNDAAYDLQQLGP